MYIKSIELKDFRNYESLSLQFNKNLNLILGKNGQGKTNLLEGLYFTALGKSFRTNNDKELIYFEREFSRVFVETEREDYDGSIEIVMQHDAKKSAKVDGVKIRKASELLNNVYVVIFSPEDLRIVKDEPEKRRRFINRELCQIKPAYFSALSDYRRVLLQRNAYLKEISVNAEVLDVWDAELSKYGAVIMKKRREFIDKLNEISGKIHENITNGAEKLEIKYAPNIEYYEDEKVQEDVFYEVLKKTFESDLKNRTSTKGPHKDDIEFFITTISDGQTINVRNFGSQGQQRTAALALKLAELIIIKEETGENPVLLLDDVMSELDIERQEFLVKSFADNQLFITTTEIPEVLLSAFPSYKKFTVEKGKVIAYEEI